MYVTFFKGCTYLYITLSDCVFVQFPDAESGEWFGYLTQEGNVALDFKGGPFKGKNIFELHQEKKNLK